MFEEELRIEFLEEKGRDVYHKDEDGRRDGFTDEYVEFLEDKIRRSRNLLFKD